MQTVKAWWRKLRIAFSLDEAIVLGLILSIFLTAYVTAACLAALMIYLIWTGRLPPLLAGIPRAFVLPAFCTLSLVVSVFSGNLQGVLTAIALLAALLIALYMRSVMTERLFSAAMTVSCAASLLSAAVIIIQTLADPEGIDSRPRSTFMNANFYATITAFILLFCLSRLVRPKGTAGLGPRMRNFHLAVAAVNLTGLYISGCRTALIALAAAVVAYLLVCRRFKALIIIGATGLALTSLAVLIPALQQRVLDIGKDVVDRVTIWQTAWRGIADSPFFGQGGGAYLLTCIRYGGPIRPHAHSLYLEMVLDFGLAGVALISPYLIDITRRIARLRTSLGAPTLPGLALSVAVYILMHGITDVTLFSIHAALLLILVASLSGIRESARRPVPLVRPSSVSWSAE